MSQSGLFEKSGDGSMSNREDVGCTLSIIIPAFDAGETLEKCLSSILRNKSTEIEVIVIDDGSNDCTISVARDIASNDVRLRVFSQSNSGQASARNRGIALANGEYIWFVDSDDWVDEHAIGIILEELFNRSPHLLVFDMFEHSAQGIKKNYFGGDVFSAGTGVGNKVISRSHWGESFFPSDIWYEDLAVIPALVLSAESVVHLSESLYHYWKGNPSSQTNAVDVEKFFDYFHAVECAISRISETEKFANWPELKQKKFLEEFVTWQIFLNCILNKSLLIESRFERTEFIIKALDLSANLPKFRFRYIYCRAHWTAALGAILYSKRFFYTGDLVWYFPRKVLGSSY